MLCACACLYKVEFCLKISWHVVFGEVLLSHAYVIDVFQHDYSDYCFN